MGNHVTSDNKHIPLAPITDGQWIHTDTFGYSQERWYRNGVLHRDGDPAIIGYCRGDSYICREIYIQNGIVYRPVPPGENSYDYPSMRYYNLSFWHSPEGKLIRARIDEGVEGVVNDEQNAVVFPTNIVLFDKDGHIRTIKQQYHEYHWSQAWYLDMKYTKEIEIPYEKYKRRRVQTMVDYTNELDISPHARAVFLGFRTD